jgi:hypothetical protein
MSIPTVALSYAHAIKSAKLMAVSLGLLFGMASVAHCNQGCALLEPKNETTLEHNYTTDIIACAALAGYPGLYDHEADMRCRDEVNCKYGVGPCPDLGK